MVIPKLPFASPNEPLVKEREEREDRAWWHYSLPEAVIATKQAAGRLIRSAEDKGRFGSCRFQACVQAIWQFVLEVIAQQELSARLNKGYLRPNCQMARRTRRVAGLQSPDWLRAALLQQAKTQRKCALRASRLVFGCYFSLKGKQSL